MWEYIAIGLGVAVIGAGIAFVAAMHWVQVKTEGMDEVMGRRVETTKPADKDMP